MPPIFRFKALQGAELISDGAGFAGIDAHNDSVLLPVAKQAAFLYQVLSICAGKSVPAFQLYELQPRTVMLHAA